MAVALNPLGSGVPIASDAGELQAMIRGANAELQRRADAGLELVAMVLADQRDCAYQELGRLRQQSEAARVTDMDEHDRFIAFLMADYERQLVELRRELGARSPEDLAELQQRLQSSTAEMEDTRADAARLQDERDEAIRETSDVRLECERRIEQARDAASDLQWKFDELTRRLDDERDQAREQACQLSEQLDEGRRDLDERNEEVRSLRGQLATLDSEIQSRPPPSVGIELENARKEAQLLRKSLIETRSELNRVRAELESLRSRPREDR
jgi:DNA repair exonuclease SbcCD ATPase subunit